MDSLLQDLRYARRALSQRPGLAIAFIATLALGIGVNAAMLGAIDRALLHPLPYPEPDRLAELWETSPDQPRRPVAPANFLDWRQQSRSFAELAAYRVVGVNLSTEQAPENLLAAVVSGNFFRTLGAPALHGRLLREQDSRESAAVAVLSRAAAARHFGDPALAIGAAMTIDRRTWTVVGVVEAIDFPAEADLWLPAPDDIPSLGIPGMDARTLRDARYLGVIGRLVDGVALAAAQQEMEAIATRLRADHPIDNEDSGIGLQALARGVVASSRPMLLALGSSVALLLAVACANVAGLVLARSIERRGELALRAALGASARRVTRQLVTEIALLTSAAGVAAIGVAALTSRGLRATLPASTPRLAELTVDWRLFAGCMAITAVVGVLIALAPARMAQRVAPGRALRGAGRDSSARGRSPVLRGLVVTQFALAVAVVAAAGLLLATLDHLAAIDPGFATADRVALRVHLPGASQRNRATNVAALQSVGSRLADLPGVESVGIGLVSLLNAGPSAGLQVEGRPDAGGNPPNIYWTLVGSGYFDTLGIGVQAGRVFGERDDDASPPVAVINAMAARLHFPGGDAIGSRIRTGLDGEDWVEVVGVVADTRDRGIADTTPPRMYRPLAQPTRWNPDAAQIVLAGRAVPRPDTLRATVDAAEPGAPVTRVEALGELVRRSFGDRRVVARLGLGFALAALALAALGIHAITGYSVAGRRREIALRMSVGASAGRVRRLILGEALRMAAAGAGLGVLLALVTTRLLRELLVGVSPADPRVYAATVALLFVVAMAAAWAPARAAAATEPMSTLRGG